MELANFLQNFLGISFACMSPLTLERRETPVIEKYQYDVADYCGIINWK